MIVPKEVSAAAASVIADYGVNFKLLGEFEGSEVYQYCFPKDMRTGFPFLYLYKDKKVKFVTGRDALEIVLSLVTE